ncbi:MAG: beta-galactosidase [Chloroflexota bacterium]
MKSRPFRLFLALVALGALVGLSYTIATWAQADTLPAAPVPPRTIPDTDVNPYGANFFLDREVEDWKRDRTVRMAREAGIVWAKQQFSWEEIEKRKGQFDWNKSDQIVATFEKYGLQIIARLDRPPAWSRKDKTIPQAPPDDLNDYGDFVDAFVRRYIGRVNYIQIWNEPNIFPEWGNRPVDPAGYAAMLEIAYKRAKAANPNVRVLSAPLAITLGEGWAPNSEFWRHMNDLDFLDALYKAGAKDYFDILSANAFGLRAAPDDPPDPKQLNFQRVVLARQIMEKHNDKNKAVWINEYGWNASPPDFTKEQLLWGRVTEQQQADYTVRGLQYARANWQWAGVFNVWYFRQVGDITPERSDYYFRMVDVDFTPRLVYLRLKETATFPQVAQPGMYQETDIAMLLRNDRDVLAANAWQPHLDPNASGGSEAVTRAPGARAIVKFWGDSFEFIMRRGPTEGRAWITLDGRPAQGLPLDTNGNSYVDLSAPNEQWQVRVPVAKNIMRGTHTVELVVGQTGEVALDGFVVSAEGKQEFPWLIVGGLGALFVAATGLFAWSWVRRK